jgi:hypothetical protein
MEWQSRVASVDKHVKVHVFVQPFPSGGSHSSVGLMVNVSPQLASACLQRPALHVFVSPQIFPSGSGPADF